MQEARENSRGALDRLLARTPNSKRLYSQALKVAPGGVMAGIKFFEPYPIFMRKAFGSHVWDVDGNEYVDYLMSYGAIALGHGHPVIREAVTSVMETVGTTVTGTPTELELDYGAMLRDLYHRGGLIRFTNSGLEATYLAVRLARGYTGRKKIAKFEGHYHGAVDRLLFSYAPGTESHGGGVSLLPIADSLDVDEEITAGSLVLPFNHWDETERRLSEHAGELACLIMEPFEEGVIPAEMSFMVKLRKLTSDLKIPLIFDEVKTGFRVRIGGATEFYSVTPDLTCLGKIIGGGLPIGAVVGDAGIMGLLDPTKDKSERIFHSGTFNGNPLSLATGKATIEELTGKGTFDGIRRRTNDLRNMFSKTLAQFNVPHVVLGEGGMFNFYLTDKPVKNYRDAVHSDLKLRRTLDIQLITEGIYIKPETRFCLSLAHSEADVDLAGECFERAVRAASEQSPQN